MWPRGQHRRMLVRRVRLDEWPRLREIRLRALADAPYAFGVTHAESLTQPDSYWHSMVEQPAWVAEDGDRWVGMVRVLAEEGAAHLVSMWVDPDARRRGVGRALVEAVVRWAGDQGLGAVTLWVSEGNVAAETLYRTAGFHETGGRQPLPSDPSIEERAMRLDIGRAH
jgi:ribosomal protein S18 acetylase RimI-like enzyme